MTEKTNIFELFFLHITGRKDSQSGKAIPCCCDFGEKLESLIFVMSECCNISPRFLMKFFGCCNISQTFGGYNSLIKYGGDTTMTWPFENNTSAIIKKLASAQLKKGRLKKIFTIIAISLATFLMASVLLLVSGIITVNQNGGNNITGSYHALISGIEKEQYQKLSDDVRVDLCGFTASIGSVKFGNDRLNISYSNKDALTLNGLSVSEGKMPEKENEILIEQEYLIRQKINAKIGDTILLPDPNNGEEKSFIITGYLKTGAKGTNRSLYAAMVSEEYFLEMDGWNNFSSAVMLRVNLDAKTNSGDAKNLILEIAADSGCKAAPSYNEAYLNLSQPSVLMVMAAVAGLVAIVIAGILVIYNIFYISIINSIKEYGQLRTIGMTAKQIQRLVFREGTLLMLPAIPIGLITGIVVDCILIPHGFKLWNVLWICLIVVALTYVTVYLSIKKPAKIAATVSPIEASRYEQNNQPKCKHRQHKLTPGFLAVNQVLRYKKKNMLTVASLVLTGVLLLGLSSVLSSINAKDMSLSGFARGQFILRISNQELMENPLEILQKSSPFTEDVEKELSQLSGVQRIMNDQHLPVSYNLQAMESDAEIVGFEKIDMTLLQSCILNGKISDYEQMASKNQMVIGRSNDFEKYFGIYPEVGSSVTLKVFDGDHTKNLEFEIAAVLDESKIGNNGDKIDMLLLPVDSMQKIAHSNLTYQYVICVEDSFEPQAENEIDQIVSDNPQLSVDSLSAAIAQNENFLQGIQLALAIAIVLIGCFSVMNLLNTILTGIIVRRKEFSLMRSVGMSQKQLSVMVHKEGLIVVGMGLVLSVIIGGGIGYVLCSFLKNNLMNYLNYQFPLGITILYCAIVILCSVLITTGALKQQSKLSMMEALR
ncbi:MAG: FtsX-like permease family protein [Lachnospiraceae bacterium]|nr:FtsX-like permease family protein [Lachnospiraceae bacterium]